jgi:hypothetical protein
VEENRRWKKLEKDRDEEEDRKMNHGGGKKKKLAFWITSAETQDESLSQSGKALLPILCFSNS